MRQIYLKTIFDRGPLWFIKRSLQFILIKISYIIKRPLCGPVLGTLAVTYRCNLRCPMCGFPEMSRTNSDAGTKELNTQQFKNIITQMKSLGISGVGFTGGEPLLREDIFVLLEHCADTGMITHLNTNGLLLDNEKIDRLFQARIDSLNISYDDQHTSPENRRHLSEMLLRIHKLNRTGKKHIRTKIATVLNPQNISIIDDSIDFYRTAEADALEFIPEQNFNAGRDIATDDHKLIKDTVNRLISLKKQGINIENSAAHLKLFEKSMTGQPNPVACYSGYNSLAVDCYGNVIPCAPRMSRGHTSLPPQGLTLKEIWFSKEYNDTRKRIRGCGGCFLNCQCELNLMFNLFKKS